MDRPAAALTAEDLGLGELQEADEILDVLDLPQLHLKPSARALLNTLDDLSSEPPSWDTTRSGTPRSPLRGTSTPYRRKRKVIRKEGVPRYLTKIVSSPLAWIEDDDQKEEIWEAASQRLSERSGRSAMGAISRTFVIEMRSTSRNPSSSADVVSSFDPGNNLELTLHEPALTSDNLGLKTWASSYLLAKRIAAMSSIPQTATILELGSGTGMVGLAAAAAFQAHVILTDLPAIVPNLERNARANAAVLSTYNAKTDVAVLDWTDPGAFNVEELHHGEEHSFPLILAADPIYSADHPRLLVQAIEHHLSKDRSARAVIEMPLRDGYGDEREDFRSRMTGIGLSIIDEGEETGLDDWSSGNGDELMEVRCWWSILYSASLAPSEGRSILFTMLLLEPQQAHYQFFQHISMLTRGGALKPILPEFAKSPDRHRGCSSAGSSVRSSFLLASSAGTEHSANTSDFPEKLLFARKEVVEEAQRRARHVRRRNPPSSRTSRSPDCRGQESHEHEVTEHMTTSLDLSAQEAPPDLSNSVVSDWNHIYERQAADRRAQEADNAVLDELEKSFTPTLEKYDRDDDSEREEEHASEATTQEASEPEWLKGMWWRRGSMDGLRRDIPRGAYDSRHTHVDYGSSI
ncbi:hypothetical protein PRZ48_004639 [Zasmidium cellare]|uniref:Uncharacterized protein n=1 Tax=Zasmidium cellare TaxID=395010 RepID=A0ABR0EQ71_ZASCE|nr:hypothetical protein PRZ48_004639 [Zasmidium cellare]